MTSKTLIVGASGGIASALATLCEKRGDEVICVSRREQDEDARSDTVHYYTVNPQDDNAIDVFIKQLQEKGVVINTAIITTGFLHNEALNIHPEKRLEDISSEAMAEYFAVNTITPALWLKHLVRVMDKHDATVACLSARVGSISDNKLGGWYGYRASKAALNMTVKTASVEYKRRLKDAMLVSYHPGTVDTGLSKPFQKNVAAKKLFTPEYTASQLLKQLSLLDRDQLCHFIDYKGDVVTW